MRVIAITCFCFAVLFGQRLASAEEDKYYDIGSIEYPVTTHSDEAQKWFDRGLAMCFAFNHEEAVRCFESAIVKDPAMAMGYWGLAYAMGPNINNMEIETHQLAKADLAIRLAKLQSSGCSDLERKLIDALDKRYVSPVPEDRTSLDEAYAEAMRVIHARHSEDSLVVFLFAESLMNLQPWLNWGADGKSAKHTPEITRVLRGGLERHPSHPGLCHLYIHAMEASPTPEVALAAANQLRDATPGLGHLLHMPSHIDIWLGDYQSAIEANRKGIAADKEFLRREGPINFYSLYRIHNYHFLAYAAMFDGQSRVALEAARDIPKQIPASMLRDKTDFLDAFMPMELHVLVRFGKWAEILEFPQPPASLPMSRSIWRYARAIAYASLNQVEQASAEQMAFLEQRKLVPESSYLFQNQSIEILKVAEKMIAGEVAYRRGQHELAYDHLREAVQLDDALNYDEPWGWMQPARHALGALLLEQGHHWEASQVYAEDLKRHPKNPWALHGLAESLVKLDKHSEAEKVRVEFDEATTRSDVRIDRSCFCRLHVD